MADCVALNYARKSSPDGQDGYTVKTTMKLLHPCKVSLTLKIYRYTIVVY